MEIKKETTIDLLDINAPALSATSDMPVIETKPDATNQGKPPALTESKPADEKPKAEVAAADEVKTPAESATAETPDEDAAASDSPKKAKGVQKRIDELVKQREDAERRAEAERQEKLRLLALVEKGGKTEEKPAPEEKTLVRPSRQQFESQEGYEAALESYIEAKATDTANRAVEARIQAERDKAQREEIERGQRATHEAYQARVAKAVEKLPDYRAVAESPDVQVSIPVAHAIANSEQGPEIQYFLGKNPDEAKRILALHPAKQLVELGKIEARLEAEASKPAAEPKPAEKPKPVVSAAPKPIKPLEAASESQTVKEPSEMSMEEYAVYHKEREKKAARPGVR
jgi:hypothetical protein